jgi:hypothetical protein
VKIRAVSSNNHRKAFRVSAGAVSYWYPYARVKPAPSSVDPVTIVAVDAELGREAFTFTLSSGQEGTVHVEQVLDYNEDPGYLRDMLLYELTLEAQQRVASSRVSKRELIRRMKTSPRQFYRLLDQTCAGKSLDQLVKLLAVLECDVQLRVRPKTAAAATPARPDRRVQS